MANAKTHSRLLALLLVVIMAATLLPLSALADDGDPVAAELEPAQETVIGEAPAAEEESAYDGADGLIPFETLEAPAALLTEETPSAPPHFYAVEGDLAVRIDTGSAYPLPIGNGSANFAWSDVKLTPSSGSALTKKLYATAIYDYSNISTDNYTPSISGYSGALFLGVASAGTYTVTYGDQPTTIGTLEIIAKNATPRVLSLGGVTPGNGATPSPAADVSGYSWLYIWLEYGASIGTSYTKDSYYVHADGSVWLYLDGVNIKQSDIAAVKIGNSDENVLDGVVVAGQQQYYLKLKSSATASLTGNDQFTVTVTGAASFSKTLTRHSETQYFLDTSDIDEAKLYIVPVNASTAPGTLYVGIYNYDYSSTSVNTRVVMEPTALTLSDGGKYEISLTTAMYPNLFGTSNNVSVAIYSSFSADSPESNYPIASAFLSVTPAMTFSTGTEVNYSSTYVGDLYSNNIAEVPSSINGYTFWVYYSYVGNQAAYRAGLTFTLADTSFNPVSSVNVTKYGAWSSPDQDAYIFNARQSLTAGSTYYLMFGKFPLVKLTAAVTPSGGSDGSDFFPGTGGNNIYGSSVIYSGDVYSFSVNAPGSTINASEWSVGLTDLLTNTETKYSGLSGSSGADYASLSTTAAPPVGVYRVTYYQGNAASSFSASPSILIVAPARSIAYDVQTAVATRTYKDITDPYTTYIDGFAVSGYTKLARASVPALTAAFYPVTPPTLGTASRTVTIPAVTSDGSRYFQNIVPASVFKTAGITYGDYYVVISDASGTVVYAGSATLTETFFADPAAPPEQGGDGNSNNGNGGNGGGSGGGGGSTSNPSKTAPAAGGSVSVSYTQSGGTATLSLPYGKVTEIISKNSEAATIDLTSALNTTSAVLPKTALTMFAEAGLPIELKLPKGTITLDAEATASVAAQLGGGSVTVGISGVTAASLSAKQQSAARGADVFSISVTGGGKNITSFDGASVTIALPYTLKAGQTAQGVTVTYIDADGNGEKLPSSYGAGAKMVTFTTNHLSLYAVGSDEALTVPFTDILASDWFFADVEYAYSNGLMTGTGANTFSPATKVSRAMLVTALYRLSGSPAAGAGSGFSDVPAGQWYTAAVAWASANGIVDGVGGGRFAPDDELTRQDMAVLFSRYAEFTGKKLAAVRQPETFTDSAEIADYAKQAVTDFNAAGLIGGVGGGRVNPRGEATRAEIAGLLHRYVEAASAN